MYLFFDVESNGLPKNKKAPSTDLDNWPRITQISWQLYDKNENPIHDIESYLIKPDGWEIPEEDFFLKNEMSTKKCEENGTPLKEVLELFVSKMENSKYLIAHNIDFDKNIIAAEFIRYKIDLKNVKKQKKICTMKESINYCKLNSEFYEYKWPSLTELYKFLFGKKFKAHDAKEDVNATIKCFFELKKRNIILKSPQVVHNLKIYPQYFEMVKNCLKKFEIRKNDRDYKTNDILNLEEYNPQKKEYTGEKIQVIVDYIFDGIGFGVEDGFVVMSITKK